MMPIGAASLFGYQGVETFWRLHAASPGGAVHA